MRIEKLHKIKKKHFLRNVKRKVIVKMLLEQMLLKQMFQEAELFDQILF